MATPNWLPEQGAGVVILDGEGIILDSNQGYTGGFLVQNNIVHDNGSAGVEAFLSNNAVIIQRHLEQQHPARSGQSECHRDLHQPVQQHHSNKQHLVIPVPNHLPPPHLASTTAPSQ